MEISAFNCQENNFSLRIFNFDHQTLHSKLKAIVVSNKDEKEHPVIASFKSIPISAFKDGKIEQHFEKIQICPGIAETKILPLISNFGNVNFACIMFLIEMVNDEVIYRSRRCSMVSSEDLCKYCKDTFQDLKLDLTELNGKVEVESEAIPKEECCSDYEENSTDVTCEQVLEVGLIDDDKEDQSEDSYNSDSKVESKIIGVTKKKRRKIKCDYCEGTYNTSDAYIKHAKKRHSQHPGLSIILQNYIDQEKALDRRKKLACPQCPKKFASKDTLLKHVKKAHAPEVAQSMVKHCPFCESTFQLNKGSNHNLYTHIKNLHDNMEDSSQFQDIVAEYMETKIVCTICGNFYSSNKSLANHVETMHGPAEFAPCEVCGKSIRQTTISINSHMMIHKGEIFICPECGSSFAKKIYLQKHMLRHNDTPFPCPECGRLFTTIMKLSRHKKIVHLKERNLIRNFHCEFCEKRFQDNNKLKIHIRSVHTKEKPFACEMCQFKCARIDNLNLHRRKSHGLSKYITQSELKELVDNGRHQFVNNKE